MTVKARLRGDAARTAILDAAHVLFSERGTDGVTMSEVAKECGVARATVFNHFGSKHALIEAITESVLEGYSELLANALADRDTPIPVLIRALFEAMGEGIESDPRFYRSVFREIALLQVGLAEGGNSHRERQVGLDRLAQLLTRGQARDEIEKRYAAEELAQACDSLVFGTLTHWLYADPSESLEERMSRASEVFLGPVAPIAADGVAPDIRIPPRTGPERQRAKERKRRRKQ